MKRILSIGFGIALGIAFLPIAIGLVGLAIDNVHLATYHWYAYFSVPAGLIIFIGATLASIIYPLFKKRSNQS